MDESGLSGLIIFLVLLVANALLALGYSALMNTRASAPATPVEGPNRRSSLAQSLAEEATDLLLSYQLGVILVRFIAAGIAAVSIAPPLSLWLVGLGMDSSTAFILAEGMVLLPGAAVMLVLGGQVPAAIGASYADRLGPLVAYPMQAMIRLLTPFSWLLRAVTAALVHLFSADQQISYITEEEIKTLVDAGQEEGVIEVAEKKMILSIFDLDETAVREVMIPRLDIVALPIDTPLDEAVQTVLAAGHSRIPVYEDNIDHIRGLLYAKDLLRLWNSDRDSMSLRDLLREAYFVPEGKSAMNLLREMQLKRVHMAIVVDEYGGTAGVVTLEDLIEEIIGEVRDEYDQHEKAAYQKVSDDEYICNARLDLDDLNELLNIHLPTDESDTLGGFIFNRIGDVPDPGTVIETEEARLEVLTVEDDRRIGQVRVSRLHRQPAPDEAAAGR